MPTRVEFLVWDREVDQAQLQPLRHEVVDERTCVDMVQQPLNLGAQDLGPAQHAAFGQLQQFVVRRPIPEKIRQAGRERPIVRFTELVAEEEKPRRQQYAERDYSKIFFFF